MPSLVIACDDLKAKLKKQHTLPNEQWQKFYRETYAEQYRKKQKGAQRAQN